MADEKHITWEVRTHEHKERSVDWYWTLGTVAVVGAAISVWFQNGLLSIIILLGAGSIWYLTVRGPREHMVKIGQKGISIDGTLHPYTSIRSFWVEEEVERPRLLLSTTSIFMPYFSLPLDSQTQGMQVREHLREFVQEVEQEPHLGEHLAEIFGL